LIQSQSLSTSSENAGTSSGGESESSNAELGDGQQTVVIGNSANDDHSLVVRLLGYVGNDSGDRNGGSIDTGHK